jgi:hypothetical protein
MTLEERHWPSLCIIALLLALSVVAVVEVCADATPVISAVLNNAASRHRPFVHCFLPRSAAGAAFGLPSCWPPVRTNLEATRYASHRGWQMTEIKEHMEVIGADGVHVGTVDKVEGNRIKLTKADSGEGSPLYRAAIRPSYVAKRLARR